MPLTAIIGGVQFRRLGFIFKHTLGTIFNKEEQARKKAAGITPLEATIVALGGTVGTGNIVGVGAAIAAGGPGALFWMWVCGFLAMAIKYCEVVASVAYRQKAEDGSYRSGPYMYIKDGLRSKTACGNFRRADACHNFNHLLCSRQCYHQQPCRHRRFRTILPAAFWQSS